MANEHYANFITEAFIKPIRSVLIVDDDYPTMDDMLDLEIKNEGQVLHKRKGKTWYDTPDRIRSVIEGFRKPARSLLVDIHDGTNVGAPGEAKIASHLHQSDLLVLDYELDKSRKNDGTRAIEILRGIMENNHFNLVVIHTSEDLDLVFQQVILGLLSPVSICSDIENINLAKELIENFEHEEEEDAVNLLKSSVTTNQYLHSRLFPERYSSVMLHNHQPYGEYSDLADRAKWSEDERKIVLEYLLSIAQASVLKSMNPVKTTGVKWSTSKTRWIKTESDFIAFSSKGENDDLLNDLHKALCAWNPAPSRLFLAKLRAEIDDYGVVAQTPALERKHALAHWYAGLLRSDPLERRWRIAESVERHSDQLLHSILPRVEDFATRLVVAEAEDAHIEARCKDHFGVDLTDSKDMDIAKLEHNAFVCSKDPQGWHLTTGHILDISGEYWACLSPACDLVPGQGKERFAAFGQRRPFTGVKLFPIDKPLKKIKVQSNLYVFLKIQGETKIFGFNAQGSEAASPISHTFYADAEGVFSDGFKLKILVPQHGKTKLMHLSRSAIAVSQLRYEYALNLLQKLGTSMTRIGLDFA